MFRRQGEHHKIRWFWLDNALTSQGNERAIKRFAVIATKSIGRNSVAAHARGACGQQYNTNTIKADPGQSAQRTKSGADSNPGGSQCTVPLQCGKTLHFAHQYYRP